MTKGEWKPMLGYPPAVEPPMTTQRRWADTFLPIHEGMKVHMVAAANEVLRHCRIGKVVFTKAAQNHSAK